MHARHTLMLTGTTYTQLTKLARKRGVANEDILREALGAYLSDASLFQQDIPGFLDGARIYLICPLPQHLHDAVQAASAHHQKLRSGFFTESLVFTRAVQHYFNQIAQTPGIAPAAAAAFAPAAALPSVHILHRHAAAARRFKL